MKGIVSGFVHFLFFYFSFLFVMSLQGSLWIQLLPEAPNPSLWLGLIVFTCFYRNLFDFILSVYIVSILSVQFTNMPLGLFILCNCTIGFALLIVRSRFIVQKPAHLALITLVVTLLFPLLHYIFSHFFESNPIHNIETFNWFLSGLITALLSIVLFQFYIWFDILLNKKWPTEMRAY